MKVLLWVPFFIFPVLVQSNFVLTIFIFSFILAIAAVSFNLIFGFTGQLSMFHAAAFGIAAYITSLTVSMFRVSFWVALVPAICFTILISIVIGSICFKFKLKAFYFAVVTLAFSELARLVILNWNSVTNGTLGLMVLDKPFVWVPVTGLIKIDGVFGWYCVPGSAAVSRRSASMKIWRRPSGSTYSVTSCCPLLWLTCSPRLPAVSTPSTPVTSSPII